MPAMPLICISGSSTMSACRAARHACKAMKPECRPILKRTSPTFPTPFSTQHCPSRQHTSGAAEHQLDQANAVGIASCFHISSFDGPFCFHAGGIKTSACLTVGVSLMMALGSIAKNHMPCETLLRKKEGATACHQDTEGTIQHGYVIVDGFGDPDNLNAKSARRSYLLCPPTSVWGLLKCGKQRSNSSLWL